MDVKRSARVENITAKSMSELCNFPWYLPSQALSRGLSDVAPNLLTSPAGPLTLRLLPSPAIWCPKGPSNLKKACTHDSKGKRPKCSILVHFRTFRMHVNVPSSAWGPHILHRMNEEYKGVKVFRRGPNPQTDCPFWEWNRLGRPVLEWQSYHNLFRAPSLKT